MNKEEIIKEIFKIGHMYEGVLMACYSQEFFTRRSVYDLVKEYHTESDTEDKRWSTVGTKLDDLKDKMGLIVITSKKQPYTYTITTKGEDYLQNKFTKLAIEMAGIIERRVRKGQQPLITSPRITNKTAIICPSCNQSIAVNAPSSEVDELKISCPYCNHRFTIVKKQPGPDPKEYGLVPKELRSENALDKQIGGQHFKHLPIQPIEYITKNRIPYSEGNVIKYITRHKFKNGIEDLKKAKHVIEIIAELEYGVSI